jgi:hypothetical protein
MPIANDQVYGGVVLNDGSGLEEAWGPDFEGCYENEEGNGRMFLSLWLHAFRYSFNDIIVET